MNTGRKRIETACACLLAALILLFCTHEALAAEASGSWRPTYDRILMYINFAIFAFVIIKYAREPLKDFLHNRKDEIEITIKRLEAEKRASAAKIKEMIETVEQSNIRFAGLKDKIIDQGEKRKAQIVFDARDQSKIIMEEARRKIDNQILQARQLFKEELVDTAFDLAAKRLPREITLDDNQKIIDRYVNNILPG